MKITTHILAFVLASTLLLACANPSLETEPLNQLDSFTPSVLATSTTIVAKPTATKQPSATLTATRTSIVTPSPVPSLVSHSWLSDSLLIVFGSRGGDGGQAVPPDLMLYPDGTLLVWGKQTSLSRQEACKLLNTIEQFGFYDYDPNTYEYPFDGAGHQYLILNTWMEKEVSVQGILGFLQGRHEEFFENCEVDCPRYPTVLPALRSTYTLLSNYAPNSLVSRDRETLIMWVREYQSTDYEIFDKYSEPWELPDISLGQIIDESECGNIDPVVTVELEQAQELSNFIYQSLVNDNPEGWYSQDGRRFQVRIRYAFPNEVPPSCQMYYSDYIPNIVFDSTYEWTCTPEDGVLEIPEG